MQKEEEAAEESPEEQEESDKGNDAVRTSSGSFARVRTMSQDMGENSGLDVVFEKNNSQRSQKENLDNSEEILFDSPSKRK